MPLGAVRAAILGIKKGIQGILVGPTQITTSTAATATAYSNQRKIDRTSNGVLWAVQYDPFGPGYYFRYSTDNGATWTAGGDVNSTGGGSGTNYTGNCSFFIDQDDYAHLVVKSTGDGYIRYYRGTPNAGRTAWTWSAALEISQGYSGWNYPDVVAHREGTEWRVHVVLSDTSGTSNFTGYKRISISSGGVATLTTNTTIGGGYSVNVHTYPSIDFHHTGDGKTVAGGTPHLYVAWSAGATGAGKGIRFRKATYSGGSWTWDLEREIDVDRYISSDNYWLNCMWDATNQVALMVGQLAGTLGIVVHEWNPNPAVNNKVTRLVDSGFSAMSNQTKSVNSGSSSVDSQGNVYLVGTTFGTPVLQYRKWTRNTNTLATGVTISSSSSVPSNAHVSAKRGYSNQRIEFIYTDGTASPYSVKYGGIK